MITFIKKHWHLHKIKGKFKKEGTVKFCRSGRGLIAEIQLEKFSKSELELLNHFLSKNNQFFANPHLIIQKQIKSRYFKLTQLAFCKKAIINLTKK